ncbi:chemotaxis protein [Sinimarinibacterium sp. CAU 1509]|uniref:chemotaxis protein n=1 Tax=Sinimarinibacterium sp. CAU 1509 TaxID=2562283 RepID=UPI0010ABD1D0|nr:chemotaxis protein [Sinimarinibacterium sp. CAU 1509]TJY59824.1 chemotaxis protein [Sinimarinibacterium sp. CAU 1509]
MRVNEQIKDVVRPAFRISIMALNAILLARRAGDAARGFGVLSGELRRFAGELSQNMEALRQLTATSVIAVTALVKDGRYLAIIDRVGQPDGAIGEQVEQVRLRQQRANERRLGELKQMRSALAQLVGDLRPLVQLGIVLARLARVEAAYGGAFAQSLTQVSAEFSRTIEQIEAALVGLTKATEGARG